MVQDMAAEPVRPLQGVIALVLVIAGVAFYLALGGLLGIVPLYAGFAFSLYFGGINRSVPSEFPAALLGSLGGVAVAAMLALLPAMLGPLGLGIALGAIALSVYALIMNWVPMLVNYAFMLMLTIATIPALQSEGRFVGMAASILLAAALMGGVILIGGLLARRKGHAAPAHDAPSGA